VNPDTYHQYPSLKKAAEGYTKVGSVKFLNRELMQTSYEKTAGVVLKEMVEGGLALEEKTPSNEAQWTALAFQLGIPEKVPVSVWALESIEQGQKILRETVWSPKTVRNIDSILGADELSGPGKFRAALLEGPPGSSKTHAARVTAALLGRPVMYVRSEAGSQSSISARLLRGGTLTVKQDRWKLMEEVARFGVNNQPASRLQYLQAVGRVMKEKGKTFQEAHRLIEEKEWEAIADAEALPKAGVLTYENVGLAEVGRRNGAVVIFDEANRWSRTNINEMEAFLEDTGRIHPLNTYYILCCNTVKDGGVAEEFNRSLIDRCKLVRVEPMNETETQTMLESMAGVGGGDVSEAPIKTPLGSFNVRAEVEQRLKQQGLGEAEIEELMMPSKANTSLGLLLSEPGGRGLLKRLAQFHVSMAEKTAEGGDLNREGQDGSSEQVTIRRLFDAYTKLRVEMRRSANSSWDETRYLEFVGPDTVADAVERMLEEVYIAPFSFMIEGEIIEFEPGSGTTDTRKDIEEIVLRCGLDRASVINAMEVGVDWEKVREAEKTLHTRTEREGEPAQKGLKAFAPKAPTSGVAHICSLVVGDLEGINQARVKNLETKLRLAGYDLTRTETVHYNPEDGQLTQYPHKKMKMKDDLLQPEEIAPDVDEGRIVAGLRNSEAVVFIKTPKPGESEVILIASNGKGGAERIALSQGDWLTVAKDIKETGTLVLPKTTIGIANIKTVMAVEKYISIDGEDFLISNKPKAAPKLEKGAKDKRAPDATTLELEIK
jgi:hypothetical protein